MNPKLKIAVNSKAQVKLLFDKPNTGNNQNGEWYLYGVEMMGQEYSYFASEKAHEMLQHYNKGDEVEIYHKPLADGKSVYEVSPLNGATPKAKTDTDMSIKWGMAFNNATKLVVSEHEFDGDIFKRVKLIEKIMPEMFKIACSMPTSETNNDDVPFK
tara:strand:- start:73 stop:543 length:471 start_codon:yes stop_codon:yes gene_type:complete